MVVGPLDAFQVGRAQAFVVRDLVSFERSGIRNNDADGRGVCLRLTDGAFQIIDRELMTAHTDDFHIRAEPGLVRGHSGDSIFNRPVGLNNKTDGGSEIAFARCVLAGGDHNVRFIVVD